MNKLTKETYYKHVEIMANVGTLIDNLKPRFYKLDDELVAIKNTIHIPSSSLVEMIYLKIKVLSSKCPNGSNNAKE